MPQPQPQPLQQVQQAPVDLSNLGTGDFKLTFTLKTRAQVGSAVINQRGTCSNGNFWDVRMSPDGQLGIETDDGASYTLITTKYDIHVNDGAPHLVWISRRQGMLGLSVDNAKPFMAASAASFGQLAQLAIGSDVCVGVDGTERLDGSVTDLTQNR